MPTFGHFNLKFEYLITLGLGNMSIRSGICMFIYYYVWPKTPIYRVIKEKLADTRIRYVRLAYILALRAGRPDCVWQEKNIVLNRR